MPNPPTPTDPARGERTIKEHDVVSVTGTVVYVTGDRLLIEFADGEGQTCAMAVIPRSEVTTYDEGSRE